MKEEMNRVKQQSLGRREGGGQKARAKDAEGTLLLFLKTPVCDKSQNERTFVSWGSEGEKEKTGIIMKKVRRKGTTTRVSSRRSKQSTSHWGGWDTAEGHNRVQRG